MLCANTPFAYKSGTVGLPLPGVEYQVEELEGIERGGEFHVRGANVMLGYLRHTDPGRLQPPASALGKGWYDTGDVVEVDAEGFVRITGRKKRFAKVAGEMVSLEVAERIASEAAPNAASAATTREQAGRGEVIVLFTEDPNLNRDHLREAARREGLPELAVARRIEHIRKIPVLASGKFDYVTLQSMAQSLE